jgi:hypothetical protein
MFILKYKELKREKEVKETKLRGILLLFVNFRAQEIKRNDKELKKENLPLTLSLFLSRRYKFQQKLC